MNNTHHPLLACPQCNFKLSSEFEVVNSCPNCGFNYTIISGIPSFTNRDFYWGEIPKELMKAVNKRSLEVGWRQALKELVQPNYPGLPEYITAKGRADWLYFSKINHESQVLDLGSGWGPLSRLLAEHSRQVISVESVIERAEFQVQRFSEENIKNIYVIHADVHKLPLQEEQFDLIIMNGLLEWIPISKPESQPRQAQIEVLKHLRSLLKPNGQIYVGIENRLGYQFFLGAPDHTGHAYTSIMPRWMASIYLTIRSRILNDTPYRLDKNLSKYRTYTYTDIGYRKLLKEAGYSDISIYTMIPSYNKPQIMFRTEDYHSFYYYINNIMTTSKRKNLVKKLLNLRMRFLPRLFAPCFGIFAQRENIQ